MSLALRIDGDFSIKQEDFDSVLTALKAAPEGELIVHLDESITDIRYAFDQCQWECLMTSGDIKGCYFNGAEFGEYYDEHLQFFKTLAPWVPDHSFIDFQGEEGELWRWFFMAGECEEHQALVTYPTLQKYDATKPLGYNSSYHS